jgi:hypothetical protein
MEKLNQKGAPCTHRRRRACYSEVWSFDQIVLAADEKDAAGGEESCESLYADTYDEGRCHDSELIEADEVEEITPEDLNDGEARAVANCLAPGDEEHALQQMNLQEVREWLKLRLGAVRPGEE